MSSTYTRRKLLGLCHECSQPKLMGKSRCQYHLDRLLSKDKLLKEYRQRNALCMTCGGLRMVGYKRCESCVIKSRDRDRQYRENKIERGLCVGCSRINNHTGTRCLRCIKLNQSSHRLRVYGISITEYDNLLDLQQGGCAICGGLSEGDRELAVDHDHKTGYIRGLLCSWCNSHVLVVIEGYSHLVSKAADYLGWGEDLRIWLHDK